MGNVYRVVGMVMWHWGINCSARASLQLFGDPGSEFRLASLVDIGHWVSSAFSALLVIVDAVRERRCRGLDGTFPRRGAVTLGSEGLWPNVQTLWFPSSCADPIC